MKDQDYENKLKEPFDPKDIEWRVGATNQEKTKGMALAYITNRAIQNRLDEVFGIFGWRNEFMQWKDGAQLCGISVLNEGEWITKWDGAADSNMEAIKGGLSDAMKRAAYQWGIGRYLYSLDGVWCPIEKRGNSYLLKAIPDLPEWALPKGYVPKPSKTKAKPDSVQEPKASAEQPIPGIDPPIQHQCSECGESIRQGQAMLSHKKFGRPLCLKHQPKE